MPPNTTSTMVLSVNSRAPGTGRPICVPKTSATLMNIASRSPILPQATKTTASFVTRRFKTVLLEFFASQDRNPRSGRGFLPDETKLLSSRLGSRGSSRQLAPLGGDFSSLLALATAFHVLHPSVEKVRGLGLPLVESFLGIGDDLTTIFLDVLNRGSGCRVDPL